MAFPFVSVIIVNYNGKSLLSSCLDALHSQTYPKDCFEVIVSDNGSKDGSLELLHEQYSWVKVLENKKNLGFARGNNEAFKVARGQYLILLNNDTIPSAEWLENLVEVARSDPKIGLVNAHLQLFYDQIELNLHTDTFSTPEDIRELGVQIYKVDSGTHRGVVQYIDGFYSTEKNSTGTFRWMKGEALLGVPVPDGAKSWTLCLQVAAPRPDHRSTLLRLYHQKELFVTFEIDANDIPKEYCIEIPATTRTAAKSVEQNTGSLVFYNGAGRDRGTYVRGTDVLYETDQGQYNQIEEVFAGCGASLLIKRETLDDIGWLDDRFFMYYEDTDLSWRARLRGWKVIYAPNAYIRHIHCGTTKEWSPFFIYLTERNRLAMVLKNGTVHQVLRVWGGYCLKVIRMVFGILVDGFRRKNGLRNSLSELRIHLRVLLSLLIWQPSLWLKRLQIQRRAMISPKSLEAWFVK